MSVVVLLLLLFLALFPCLVDSDKKDVIELYRITSVLGSSINGAQWLAVQEVNNDSDFLSNYEFRLTLKIYRDNNMFNDALNHLLDFLHQQNAHLSSIENAQCLPTTNSSSNSSVLRFPIILGMIRSSISTLLASVAGVNHIGLMSATSTSVALSDSEIYPFFYRSIASDALQSKGIIFLCETFKWKRIVVLYGNDAYGLHLALGIQELSKLHGIDVTSIALQYENDITFLYAARQIKEIEKYIIILILGAPSVSDLLNIFEDEGLLQYPYYYLGVDSWIDSSRIIENKTKGFMGTVPWNIHTLRLDEYDDDIMNVINISSTKTIKMKEKWDYLWNNGYAQQLETDSPRAYSVYAYDATYTLFHLIDEIEKEYGVGSMYKMLENNSTEEIMEILNYTIINKVNFIGLTGHTTFDGNGDRQNGLFSFANSLGNGSVNYIGYFLENKESFIGLNGSVDATNLGIDSIKSEIDINKIIWPSYFVEKGIIPHSDIIIDHELLIINGALSITIFIFCILFILFILFGMIFIIWNRSNIIIKRGSWTMNSIMCIGCILSFITSILYGLDEEYISYKLIGDRFESASMNILCSFRLYLIVIAFTMTVMPLFLKTWRLVQIFNNMSSVTRIYDKQLFFYILICIIIDFILLTIFILIEPYQRSYHYGDKIQIDQLQYKQFIYGQCQFSDRFGSNLIFYFYIILILWKFGQLLFGIYCALNVARIHNNPSGNKNVLARFLKFDETGAQLASIATTFIILCISVLFISLIPTDSPSLKYVIITSTILLIGLSVFLLNLSPRIIAVIKKDTKMNEKYTKSVEDRFKETLKTKILNMQQSITSNGSIVGNKETKLKTVSTTSSPIPDIVDHSSNNNNLPRSVNELASYVDIVEKTDVVTPASDDNYNNSS